MRVRAAAAVVLLVSSIGLIGAAASAGQVASAAEDCKLKPGTPSTGPPWAQTRLNFQSAWPVTTGHGVVVAVIDSGLDVRHRQLRTMRVATGVDVIGGPAFPRASTRDCYGHGTMVTGIIAAQRVGDESFAGVAPGVTIVPIKQTDTQSDKTGQADGIARGIDAAIAARAQVVNISVTSTTQNATGAQLAALRAAVSRAAKHNVVIVAAAGNDGTTDNLPAYPAAFSTSYPNVIAVSATDAHDQILPFSTRGNYVSVAAPGVKVEVAAPFSGYETQDGTSFAAPFVTGTVALLLAAHPNAHMTAAQVRDRIEATADRPPATVPDPKYGYGIVNPYLAVTAVREDGLPAPGAQPASLLPARAAAPPADRHLTHVALATAVVLLGLAVLAATGAAVLRSVRSSKRQNASAG